MTAICIVILTLERRVVNHSSLKHTEALLPSPKFSLSRPIILRLSIKNIFYNWCKRYNYYLKNSTKSNFFLVFLQRKSCFSCTFSFASRLKVELRLAIFNLSTYFFLLSTIQDFHFLVDTVSLFADPDFDVFLKHPL